MRLCLGLSSTARDASDAAHLEGHVLEEVGRPFCRIRLCPASSVNPHAHGSRLCIWLRFRRYGEAIGEGGDLGRGRVDAGSVRSQEGRLIAERTEKAQRRVSILHQDAAAAVRGLIRPCFPIPSTEQAGRTSQPFSLSRGNEGALTDGSDEPRCGCAAPELACEQSGGHLVCCCWILLRDGEGRQRRQPQLVPTFSCLLQAANQPTYGWLASGQCNGRDMAAHRLRAGKQGDSVLTLERWPHTTGLTSVLKRCLASSGSASRRGHEHTNCSH